MRGVLRWKRKMAFLGYPEGRILILSCF